MKRKLNSEKFWDEKIKENFVKISISPIYIDKLRVVLNLLKHKNGDMLDVGIGYGHLEECLVESKSKLNLFGIDISEFAIQNAQKKYKGIFLREEVNNLSFINSKFKVVVALDVLEHLPENKCVLSLMELNRVMKSKADLIVSVPLNENKNDGKRNHHLQTYSLSKLNKQLNKAGFFVVKKYFLTAFKNHYFIKSLINKLFKFSDPNLLIVLAQKYE